MTRLSPIQLALCVLCLALLGLTGCKEDLISDHPFACETNEDCATDWNCNTIINECVKGPFDAGTSDATDASDTDDEDTSGAESCVETGFGKPGCSSGTYCLGLPVEDPTCIDSECDQDVDCSDTEKCLLFEDDFGVCISSGDAALDSSCSGSDEGFGDSCDGNSYCVEGQCRAICDPFSASGMDCAGQEDACLAFTAELGVCMPRAQLLADSGACVPNSGAMCADAEFCAGTGETGICVRMCRLGRGDCDENEICNEYLAPGLTNVGICTNSCNTDFGCRGDQVCRDGMCTQPTSCSNNSECSRSFQCGTDRVCQ